MPKQIQTPAIGQKLVKLFSLKGRFQPVLDEVIVPVVEVGAEEVESRPASAQLNVGATAAEFGFMYILNPSGSEKRVKLTGFHADAGATDYLYGKGTILFTLGLVNDMDKGWREPSLPGVPVATVQLGRSTVAMSNPTYRCIVGSGITAKDFFDFPIILSPGQGWQFQLATANVALAGSLLWEESDLVAQG